MTKRVALFILLATLLMVVSIAFAGSNQPRQISVSDQSETDLVSHADAVVQRYNATLGQPTRWTYTYSLATNDGSLGCPLVASYNLGYYVQPYRVELTYEDNGPYVVYVSYRGGVLDVTVPCSPQLGVSAMPATPLSRTCTATALYGRNVNIYGEPDRLDVVLGQLNNYAYLPVTGRTADTSFYLVDMSGLAGWVSFFDVSLGGADCNSLPVVSDFTASNFPDVSSMTGTGGVFTCYLSAIQARVRSAPSLGAPILDEVNSGEVVGVVSKNAGQGSDLWYQVSTPIGNGWVSSTVSSVSGNGCTGLAITAGTQTTNEQGQQVDIALPPTSTNCPAGYAGLNAPRLQAGADAVVTFDGLRLRTEPLPREDESNVVFQLPMGSIFGVITGPVCEQTRVWWQVRYNNTIGWLAESDTPVGYYTEPRVVAPGVRFDPPLLGVSAEIGRVETGGNVSTIAFTSAGEAVAVANGTDSFIRSWDTATGNIVTENFLHRSDIKLNYVAYQPGGDLVVVADLTRTVSVWQNGEVINFLSGRFEPIFPGDVVVSPDWSSVAISGCVSADGANCAQYAVNIIELVTNNVLNSYEVAGARSIAYSADGTQLAAVSGTGQLSLIDMASGDIQIIDTGFTAVRDLSFTPAGDVALIAKPDTSTPYSVIVWSVEAGSATNIVTLDTDITSFVFSADGALLALGDNMNKVILWDMNGNKSLESFEGYINGITSLAFSADSQTLASGDNAGNLVLLNVGLE